MPCPNCCNRALTLIENYPTSGNTRPAAYRAASVEQLARPGEGTRPSGQVAQGTGPTRAVKRETLESSRSDFDVNFSFTHPWRQPGASIHV
jgi:hypothetical protein